MFVHQAAVLVGGLGLESNLSRATPATVNLNPFKTLVTHSHGLSSGDTVVLTVVDRFSKTVHFIPVPKLPTARDTAYIFLDHVFHTHGLPVDVSLIGVPSLCQGFGYCV